MYVHGKEVYERFSRSLFETENNPCTQTWPWELSFVVVNDGQKRESKSKSDSRSGKQV